MKTPKAALQFLTQIANKNKDVELTSCGNLYEMIINGHERGWIKSGLRKPCELLAWVEGVNNFMIVFD